MAVVNLVQSAQGGTGAGGVVLPAAPTAGNLLVCVASDLTTTPVLAGNFMWTQGGNLATNPRTTWGWRFAQAGETAAQQVTSTAATSCVIYEFSSQTGWPANPLFGSSLIQNPATTPPNVTSNAFGPAPSGAIVVATVMDNQAGTTNPTAFTGATGASLTVNITNWKPTTGGTTGNGICGYSVTPVLDSSGNVSAITATYSGTVAAGATICVMGFYPNPIGFTGNYVCTTPTGGSSTVNLPSAPGTGNLLVATGITTGNIQLTASANWNIIFGIGAATRAYMAWRFVGGAGSPQQTPFAPSTAAAVTVTMAEFASASGWVAVPFDVYNGLSQSGSGSPPTAQSPSITPTFASDFVVLMTYLANLSSNTVSSVAGMTKISDLVLTPGTSGIGPGSLLYQLNVGTSPYSVALNFTGPSSGVGVLVAAFNPIGFSHGTLSQTLGCTLSATGTTLPTIHGSLNQTCSCSVSATIANPIAVTTNFASQLSPTAGSTTITLPRAPTQGNLLVAFGSGPNGGPITAASGWKIADNAHYDSAIPYPVIAWKIAGASESATQTPFINASGTARLQTCVVEVYGVFPWSPNDPVDVSSAAAGVSSTPPVVETAPVTPTAGPFDFAFVFVATSAGANYSTTPPPGMTLLANVSWSTATGTGPASVYYQPVIGTSPYSQTVSFGGSVAGVAVGVVAALTIYIRGALSKTCGCTLSATGKAAVIHGSLSQTLPCTIQATATRTTHAHLAQTIGCTLVATGKTTPIHASLSQTVSCSLVATGTAKVIHASLSQTVSCSLVATGGQSISADVAQVALEIMMTTNAVLPFLAVAQVVIESMASYQTVPLQVSQVAVEYMSPAVYPYNPQPPGVPF